MGSDEQLKEEFEERAAIMQFDGKMTREEAETQAGLEQLRRLRDARI